jgi:alpha-tubulin suppressor-like RCC1 family protein
MSQSASASPFTIDITSRIAAGDEHTCAIASDDSVWCWGRNNYGQLGIAQSTTESATPLKIQGTLRAKKIAAGSNHTCVLTDIAAVWCWGQNTFNQLGVLGATVYENPIEVVLAARAKHVKAGGDSTCAMLTTNEVQCWGSNYQGQLGNGLSDKSHIPRAVTGIPSSFTVKDIEMGSNHTCSVSTQGEVWCWGAHGLGRLGSAANQAALTPLRTISIGSAAIAVTAGEKHTCVVRTDSQLSCFGGNNVSQIGQSANGTVNATPTVVAGTTGAMAVASGNNHTCVITTNNALSCFGGNDFGQVGAPQNAPVSTPTPQVVANLSDVVDVVGGASHTCAVVRAGDVKCWGSNGQGQAGHNDVTDLHLARNVLIVGAAFNVRPPEPEPEPEPEPAPDQVVLPPPAQTPVVAPVPRESVQKETAINESLPEVAPVAVTDPVIVKKTLVTPVRIRKGRSISAARLATSVSLKIPKKSQGTMRISIVRGTKQCKFVGSTIRGIRRGKCDLLVVIFPKKGKPVLRRNTISVV